MINKNFRKVVYQKSSDKHNENVICYVGAEVILCR